MLSKSLYKSLLRTAQDLHKEFDRGAIHVFPDKELNLFRKEYAPSLPFQELKTNNRELHEGILTKEIRNQFKQNAKMAQSVLDDEIDRGFDFLRELHSKINILRNMVYTTQSTCTTNDVRVDISSYHADSQASYKNKTIFSYHVHISNLSKDKTVQLQNRHWKVLEIDGNAREFDGPGVLGRQPTLAPGNTHTYSSHTDISAYHGTMSGYFGFLDIATGEEFRVNVSPIGLAMRKKEYTTTVKTEVNENSSQGEAKMGIQSSS